MKPFAQLFDSAAAHGLLLNSFHQHDDGVWSANWRRVPEGLGLGFSNAVRGAEPYETLSRSLMLAITELAPAEASYDLFGEGP